MPNTPHLDVIRWRLAAGQPRFAACDLCAALAISNPARTLRRHCSGRPRYGRVVTAQGPQHLRLLDLPDVRRLLAGYPGPVAAACRRWLDVDLPRQLVLADRFAQLAAQCLWQREQVLNGITVG